MGKHRSLPSADELHRLFRYEDGKLYRRVSTGNQVKAGDRAGSVLSTGYRMVRVSGILYYEHRIVYKMFHPDMDDALHIDHINGLVDDNHIENLRLVTHQGNHQNKKMYKRNTSGVTGVWWDNSAGKWVARVWVLGKRHNLGCFEDKEEAAKVAAEFRKANGFSDRHGTA